jgi:hypothetical protein
MVDKQHLTVEGPNIVDALREARARLRLSAVATDVPAEPASLPMPTPDFNPFGD